MKHDLKALVKSKRAVDAVDDLEFRNSFATDVDRYLPAYAGIVPHLFALLDGRAQAVRECQDLVANADRSLAEAREMVNSIKSMAKDNQDLRADNETKTAELRRLRKEIDPDEIQLKIMYAIDEATARKDQEIRSARAEIVELRSRVEELERSKKKLREAIARLSEKT
jgi:vacuolar-type H+-ATPase subunit I/STV1